MLESQLHLVSAILILLAGRDSGIISFSDLQGDIGLDIHVVSMFFFSVLLWIRFYYSQRSGRRMIEDVDATL